MASTGSTLSDLRLFVKYHLVRRRFDYPAPETELGIELLEYDTDRYAETLLGHADRFEIDCLGEVEYQGRAHPIHRIRVSGAGEVRRSLVVLCGVHGNEYAGLLAVPLLLEQFSESPECLAHLDLCIVAPVNPVGAQESSRYNAEGYDVNRDFKRFDTPEARAVRRAIEEAEPDFILSLHEGPHDGTFMFANHDVDPGLAAPVLERLERAGTRLATVDYFGRTLDRPGYARPTRPMKIAWWLWSRVLGMMSTGMYAHELGTPEITLESAWRDEGGARIRTHVELVLAIIEWLRPAGEDASSR
jgi:hypothetical protein